MANFFIAYCLLAKIEYSKPSDFLHFNRGERAYTLGGIYQAANPDLKVWRKVEKAINETKKITAASIKLFNDMEVQREVMKFFKKEYWNKLRLSEIKSQQIANEIFIFAVNTNRKLAAKKAQKIVGVNPDGIIGKITLAALNSFDEDKFNIKFDEQEINFYKKLVARKPHLKHFINGWVNRAKFV